jgi:hypothetical protein
MTNDRVPFVIWLVVALLASTARADSLDSRFLEGLRQRRLFSLAEAHCIDRLSRVPPRDPAQAELAVELTRTLALHAASVSPQNRAALWAKAHSAAADFLRQSPPHPRAVVVRFQDALTLLAQGELGRQELEAGALPAEQLEPTRQTLRQATTLLESLDKELKAEIPLRRRTRPRDGEFSADELAGLAEQVQHQLARTQKNRALLFARGSDDRLSLLLAATDTLQWALPQASGDDPLREAIQLDLAECQRLLGRQAEATDLAAALDQDGIEPATRLRARAELIRIALVENNLAAALRMMEQGGTIDGRSYPELDLAHLETLLAVAQAAGEGKRTVPTDRTPPAEAAKQYQQQAAQAADALEQTYGPYWGRRASQLLIAALPRGAMASVELLSRAADGLYLKGDLDQAIAAYDDAAAQARRKPDSQAAFELAYKAALVEQQRGRHTGAANRLRILAKNMPTHPQAAPAHLLAAWNVAQQAQSDASAASSYEELLKEHLANWPAAESAGQAHLWLGQRCEARADWFEAIDAYTGVSPASPHYAAAIAALARCWPEALKYLDAAGKPTPEAAQQAVLNFKRAIAGPDNRWPERWTEADRTAALGAAELITAYQPGSASDAEELLRRSLAGAFDAPPDWKTAAQSQLVVAVAAQGGRQKDALAELKAIGVASADQMLAVLAGLSHVAERSNERSRPQIANVQLAAVAMVAEQRDQLTREQQLALARVEAEAFAATGRKDQALAAYQQLAKSNPASGQVQEGYARLLLASSDPAQLQQSLDQWRIVASHSQPRTPRWFEAKYSVALAQFKLGNLAGAAKLLRYMLETPPGLAGTEWEQKFSELLRRCESK